MALKLYTSNRMEHLLEAAAALLANPLSGSPLTAETIIVQSKGMQRWLSMELAKRFGVWANARYPFPNKFVADICRSVLADKDDGSGFTPGVMRWKIMALLPGLMDRPQFAELKGYLSSGSRGMKLYQLAGKIADLFDQYTLYRGEMITSWEKGGGEGWQPILWRAVCAEAAGLHREALRKSFLTAIREHRADPALFPERLTVFGISSLPRFHMDILGAVATHTEVNLFVLSPCEVYWGDIVPGRVLCRLPAAETAGVDSGNPLLASLGRLGRDFSNLVLDYEYLHGGGRELYTPAEGESLLALLQNDLLRLQVGEGSRAAVLTEGDRSITIHSCHSPMREVEVLFDNILEMFESLPGLKPRDILVMTPDIELYAPYIDAIFDGEGEQHKKIPYSIADRSILTDGRVAATFLAILTLGEGRFQAPTVMDILAADSVRSCFALTAAEIDLIRSWIEETRIRWGLNGAARESAGLPGYSEQSWSAGLDRLLLGLAMADDDGSLFADIIPYDAMEGGSIKTLGKLVTFVERLHGVVTEFCRARTVREWADFCRNVLDLFFLDEGENAGQTLAIYEILDELENLAGASGFNGDLDLAVIRAWLGEHITVRQRGLGFMTGGVTFCAMLPMRSIPFRVVTMLGMNDGDFPRQNRPAGFDLIARNPMPGDRSLRNEDRYLFLEALLSARDRLYISHVGQGARDNARIPPSVLVCELLDYLGQRLRLSETQLEGRIYQQQRLQPFSPAYFSGSGNLFTYSAENFKAVCGVTERLESVPEFITTPLPEPAAEMLEISIQSLLAFFRNPCRYLLTNRLGIRLDDIPPPLEEREPFAISPLDRYYLMGDIIRCTLEEGDVASLLPLARARGVLPPAAQGERAFETARCTAESLAGRVKAVIGDVEQLPPLDLDLAVGRFRIRGRLADIWPKNLVRYRTARFGGRDAIRLWLKHLLLNLAETGSYPATSVLITEDATIRLGPVARPLELLHELLEFYYTGLCRPLRFFPKSSFDYARKSSLESALNTWENGDYPEAADPYYRIVFAEREALNDEFRRLALAVFKPFNEHRERE